METRKMKLALSAGALALSLALAGCGGGGSGGSPSAAVTDPPAETEAEKNERLGRAANTAEDALGTETSALTTLAAAVDKAGSARMMAKKYSEMLETLKVDGNSKAAMDNAAMVLQAKMDLMSAITDTGAAIDALVTARDALPDGTDVAEINTAIKDAEDLVEDAQKVHDGDELAKFVNEVTGGPQADPQGTAKSVGEGVAMDIAMALAPMTPEGGSTTADGTSVRVMLENSDDATARPDDLAGVDEANKYQAPVSKDSKSMTWMEITGASKKMRIAEGTDDTKEVYVSSIANMVLASTLSATDNADDGKQYALTYKGIPGTAICVGTSCKVETVANVGTVDNSGNRKFAGSWYFTPTDPMQIYKKASADPEAGYVADDMFATFGHWLTVDSEGARVHTYAYSGGNTEGLFFDVDQASKNPDLKSDTATYSGNAAGRSVHKTFDPNGKMTDIQSGRFTANVMLTAKFGENPMLGGTIDGFEGTDNPMAVDPSWEVTLKDTGIETAGTLANTGVTVGMTGDDPGQAGDWSANAYGRAATTDSETNVTTSYRPTGIFGDFNAHFKDGHVAGAYATRKN